MATREDIERVEREARAAVNEAVRAAYDRRQFVIEKFGRHRDGYLHARLLVGERPVYITCQYGSWLAPGQLDGREVDKEPEALLGPDIGREVRFALSEEAQRFERREREHAEPAAAKTA